MERNQSTFLYLQNFERTIFSLERKQVQKSFRNINKGQWIKNASWPIKANQILRKISLGNVYPGNFSLWFNNLKYHLGNKKVHRRGYKNLIGYLLLYPFVNQEELPLLADAVFFKRGGKYVVLFYAEKSIPSLFKVNVRYRKFKEEVTQEIKSHLIANSISHPFVGTPKLLSYKTESEYLYTEQELLFNCTNLKNLPTIEVPNRLKEVFDFMFEFYKQNGLQLKMIDNTHLDFDLIKKKVDIDFPFQEIVEKYLVLNKSAKKMIFGRVHGDLCYNNILVSDNKTYIIDWGLSREAFWAEDIIHKLIYLPYNLKVGVFSKIVSHFGFDSEEIFTLEEQQFLTVCNRVFQRIMMEGDRSSSFLKDYLLAEKKVLEANNLL